MNREDIIRMAREAGLHYSGRCTLTGMESHIERFAALVASAEREACAEIGDSMDACQDGAIGRAIRARGQA